MTRWEVTMMRLIDADALPRYNGYALSADAVAWAVERAPTIDAVPVVHGEWVVSRTDYSWNGAEYPTHCKCNQCGREVPYQDRDNYCPNCGAKMDGGAEG